MAGAPISRSDYGLLKLQYFLNNQSPSFDSLSLTQRLQLTSFKPSNADEFFAKLTRIGVKFSRPPLETAAAAGTQMKNMNPGSQLPIATVQVSVAPEAEQQDNTLASQSTAAAANVEQRTAAPAAVLGSAAPSVVQESTAPAAVQVSVAPAAEQQDNTLAPPSTAAAAEVVQESTAPAAVQGSAASAAKLPAAVKRPSRGESVGHTPNSDNSKKKSSLRVHAAISRGGARNPNQIDFGMGEPNVMFFHQVRHCCLTIGCADFIAGQVLFPVQYCSVNERA